MFRIHMLPAGDGDCFLVETGTAPHRILIDGGRKAASAGILSYLKEELPQRQGPLVDLLVLTHIDSDHIGGLLDLLPKMSATEIGAVWFNGLRHALIARGDPAPPPPRRNDEPGLEVLGFREAREFDRLVSERQWKWNADFPDTVAATADEGDLPAIPLPEGGRITLLGPPRRKLGAFADSWERWYRTVAETDVLYTLRWSRVVTVEDVPVLALDADETDTAAPNGTSITFVVEHGKRRALFCADAHPGDVAAALTRFGGQGRQHFDAIKVAHHGSAANNTSTLIERLESPIWLVSSNGKGHGHPHGQAMARIALSPGSADRRILFNYPSDFNRPWADEKLEKAYGYKAMFPGDGQKAMIVDLI